MFFGILIDKRVFDKVHLENKVVKGYEYECLAYQSKYKKYVTLSHWKLICKSYHRNNQVKEQS